MIYVTITPSQLILDGPTKNLEEIYNRFSFKDLHAENQYKIFMRTCREREKKGATWDNYDDWKEKRKQEFKKSVHRYACEWDQGKLILPIGLHDTLLKEFNPIIRSDSRDFEPSRKVYPKKDLSYLRPIQQMGLEISRTRPMGVFKLATGVGKTALAEAIIYEKGIKSIFLVPSASILNQTVRRFQKTFGKDNVGQYGDGKKKHGWITVATYQSLCRADANEFNDYRLMFGDEIRHVPADTFFSASYKLNNCIYRYGLSADISRPDGAELLVEAAAGPIILDYPAKRAIKDGFLAKPQFVSYFINRTRGSFGIYKMRRGKRTLVETCSSQEYSGYDDLLAYRNWIVGNDVLTEFVSSLILGLADKSILVLIDEKEHGERLLQYLPDAGFAIGGQDNEDLIARFNKRELKVLIATSTLGEGTDLIPTDVLINLQGGKDPTQAVGRALRLEYDKDSKIIKDSSMIIDFVFPNKTLENHYNRRKSIYEEYDCGPVLELSYS